MLQLSARVIDSKRVFCARFHQLSQCIICLLCYCKFTILKLKSTQYDSAYIIYHTPSLSFQTASITVFKPTTEKIHHQQHFSHRLQSSSLLQNLFKPTTQKDSPSTAFFTKATTIISITNRLLHHPNSQECQ
jgi:hypothetical protein